MKAEELFKLYQKSQQKVEEEQLIQNSLLLNIINNLEYEVKDFCTIIKLSLENPEYQEILLKKLKSYLNNNIECINKRAYNGQVGVYEPYSYEIGFKINGKNYLFEVPNFLGLDTTNILNTSYGRYRLLQEVYDELRKTKVWNIVKVSYQISDIKEALTKILEC